MRAPGRLTGRWEMVAELCGRHGVTLTPETRVDTKYLGAACYIYVGESPYSVAARREEQGTETIVYVSAALLPGRAGAGTT